MSDVPPSSCVSRDRKVAFKEKKMCIYKIIKISSWRVFINKPSPLRCGSSVACGSGNTMNVMCGGGTRHDFSSLIIK